MHHLYVFLVLLELDIPGLQSGPVCPDVVWTGEDLPFHFMEEINFLLMAPWFWRRL